MKRVILASGAGLLVAACGGDVNPEVLAAFKAYLHEVGAEMSDSQAACVAGIQEDVFGREDAIRMLRQPREWNLEALSGDNWEQTQQRIETASQRVLAECDIE